MKFQQDSIEWFKEQVELEGNPQLFCNSNVLERAEQSIPEPWKIIIGVSKPEEEIIKRLWHNLHQELPQTIELLKQKLNSVAILTTEMKPPSFLYLFSNSDEFYIYRGFIPVKNLPVISNRLSVDLSSFYSIHDGWVDFYSGDTGPLPSNEWQIIGQDANDSDGFLVVFGSGSAKMGFDIANSPAPAYELWPDDDDVELIDNFWATLDEWIASNLEDFDNKNN